MAGFVLRGSRLRPLVALVLAAIACRDEPTLPAHSVVGQQAQRASQINPKSVLSGETLFAELTQSAPTSAGFFFDPMGRIVVNVVSAADGPAAVSAVRGFLDRGDIVVPDLGAVTIFWRPVRYSFAELAATRNLVFDSVYAEEGLVSLDLDEARILSVSVRQREERSPRWHQ